MNAKETFEHIRQLGFKYRIVTSNIVAARRVLAERGSMRVLSIPTASHLHHTITPLDLHTTFSCPLVASLKKVFGMYKKSNEAIDPLAMARERSVIPASPIWLPPRYSAFRVFSDPLDIARENSVIPTSPMLLPLRSRSSRASSDPLAAAKAFMPSSPILLLLSRRVVRPASDPMAAAKAFMPSSPISLLVRYSVFKARSDPLAHAEASAVKPVSPIWHLLSNIISRSPSTPMPPLAMGRIAAERATKASLN